MAGLGIDAGGHELGGHRDDGKGGFWIDEVVELGLALVVVAGDAHDIPAIGGGQVLIGIDQGLAHALRMVDVLAEDDGLGVAIRRLEKLGDLGGDQDRALFEYQIAVIVAVVVFAILDGMTKLVGLPQRRSPAVQIPVKPDPHHLVGRQKAVGDPLPQGVAVEGLAEVVDVGDVLGFLGGGRHPDLGSRGEVFEHLAPGGIVRGTAPVTLVHEDQIEEVRGELPVDVLLLLGAGHRLIEAEIDLERLVHPAVGDLGQGLAEGLEIVGLGLVGQDIAIHQEEDAFLGAGSP